MRKPIILTALVSLFAHQAAAQSPATINGARFELRFPVSPGAYAQTYGSFAGVPETFAQSVPLPAELGGTQVFIDGRPAGLYAVSSTVVSYVVPFQTPAGRVAGRVVRDGQELGTFQVDVLPVSPGIFHVLEDPLKQGGILNQDSVYAIQNAPARRGQVIQIFATGQGAALSGSVADGAVPPAGTLINTTTAPDVHISVDKAQVIFSGLSPQFPGLWQINAVVPDKDYIRGQVPVFVSLDGVSSNVVSFWVAE